MITKIISGGQTGADQGGLAAAQALGLATGGLAPKGFRTERGARPELGTLYHLTESTSSSYLARTQENVAQSDGTVIFGNVSSPGSFQTKMACLRLKKPFIANPSVNGLREWIATHNIKVLNVAGNRESKNPGIESRVREFLVRALKGDASA
jgi:hypothetical protein